MVIVGRRTRRQGARILFPCEPVHIILIVTRNFLEYLRSYQLPHAGIQTR